MEQTVMVTIRHPEHSVIIEIECPKETFSFSVERETWVEGTEIKSGEKSFIIEGTRVDIITRGCDASDGKVKET